MLVNLSCPDAQIKSSSLGKSHLNVSRRSCRRRLPLGATLMPGRPRDEQQINLPVFVSLCQRQIELSLAKHQHRRVHLAGL